MKIIKQRKNEKSILNTELKDKKGNQIVIDTTVIGIGGIIDFMFEGQNTSGEIEMMIELNGEWINRTQRRYSTKEKAEEDHKKIVKGFEKNGVKEILNFNEVCGGGEAFSETKETIKKLIKGE